MSSVNLKISDDAKVEIVTNKKNHIGIFDFLRGFAALIVLLFHYASSRGLVKFYSPTISSLFTWGNMGVEVFFVISGFIIPYSLQKTGYKINNFFRFIAKRLVRIAPPAYVCIGLILLQWFLLEHFIKHAPTGRLSTLTIPELLGNLLFTYGWQSPHWINPVFWTLAIEFQFYIIVGLFYPVIYHKNQIIQLVLFFALLTGGYYVFHIIQFSIFGYSPLFAMGGITLYYRNKNINTMTYLGLLGFFALLMANIMDALPAAFGLATSLAIAFINVKHPIFSFFGKISYSLYLLHLLVGATVEYALAKVYHPKTELGNAFAILICIAAAIGVSYAYYMLIEKRFIKLSQRIKD